MTICATRVESNRSRIRGGLVIKLEAGSRFAGEGDLRVETHGHVTGYAAKRADPHQAQRVRLTFALCLCSCATRALLEKDSLLNICA